MYSFKPSEKEGGLPRRCSGKNSAAHAGDARVMRSILGSERSPGVGDGSPLQHSCLEIPKNRGAWQTTVHEAIKIRTQRNNRARPRAHTHTHTHTHTHQEKEYKGGVLLVTTCSRDWQHPINECFHVLGVKQKNIHIKYDKECNDNK